MRHSDRVLLADGRVVPAVAWAAWVLLDAAGVTLSWDAARGVRMRPALPADDPVLRAVAPHREVLRQVVQALAEADSLLGRLSADSDIDPRRLEQTEERLLALRAAASALISLLVLQILLGMGIIFTLRRPIYTTSHVVVGALLLCVTFWITWVAHRDRLERPSAS